MELLGYSLHPPTMAAGAVFVIAYFTSSAVQRVVRRLAIRFGFLDHPDKNRRSHAKAVPRLGGVGVFAALIVASAAGAAMDSSGHVVVLLPLVISMAAGAAILFFAGLTDDLIGVPPLGKLAFQTGAALLVYYFGFRIDRIILPPDQLFQLGMLTLPVTVLWIVGLSNAFNLIDGADGLAGGVATIVLIATAISAAVLHDNTVLWCSLALIGAMLGFLRFNWPPARIFLGDSGSLVVGFLLAILTVKGMSRADGAVYGLAPIFALAYPLLDTGIAMLRRWLRREPLSRADGRHIHHQLQALGFGPRQTLMILYAFSTLIAVLGLLVTFAPPQLTIAVAVAGGAVLILILVYGARLLQYHELLEAGSSMGNAVMTARDALKDKIRARDVARLIARARNTEELAAVVEDSAVTFRFAHMQLRWGMSRATPPVSMVADVQNTRLWALDYPITARLGRTEPLFLGIWCSIDTARAIGVERVAEILAPALEEWMLRHGDAITSHSFVSDHRRLKFDPSLTPADVPRQRSSGRAARRVGAPDLHKEY